MALTATALARRCTLPAGAFVPFAVGTEFLIAAALSAPIMGWQHRLGADTLAWFRGNGPEALALGAGIFPLASLWIILFATIIPMRPRLHLWGAGASLAPPPGYARLQHLFEGLKNSGSETPSGAKIAARESTVTPVNGAGRRAADGRSAR